MPQSREEAAALAERLLLQAEQLLVFSDTENLRSDSRNVAGAPVATQTMGAEVQSAGIQADEVERRPPMAPTDFRFVLENDHQMRVRNPASNYAFL